MKTLVLDTETTGIPIFADPTGKGLAMSDAPGQPRMVQLAGLLHDDAPDAPPPILFSAITKPEGWEIDEEGVAFKSHGITNARAQAEGRPIGDILAEFDANFMAPCDQIIAFSATFDRKILRIAMMRHWGRTGHPRQGQKPSPYLCLMKTLTPIIRLPATQRMIDAGRGAQHKTPNLAEAHAWAFKEGFAGAHDALNDVKATHRLWLHVAQMRPVVELVRLPDRDS